MIHTLRNALVPALLGLCLLLGGASAAGFAANFVLQLVALPIIVWALVRPRQQAPVAAERYLLGLATALVAVFAIQLIPLPPALWSSLPGRDGVVDGYRLVGQPLPWLPLSLTPGATLASGLWLLPAFAVLLAILSLGAFRAKWIAWTIVGVSAASVVLGALQLAGGNGPPWYLYRVTNFGKAVGFFANSNHAATLLVVTIPFLAALVGPKQRGGGRAARKATAVLMMAVAAFVVIVIGLVLNFSLAGLGLAVPAIGASALLVMQVRKVRVPRWSAPLVGVLAVAAIVAIMTGPFGNNLTDSAATKSADSRYTSFSTSLAAAGDYLPFGSGIGSFQPVYRQYENPAEVSRTFMNHAHSDVIEILLEAGLLGGALLVLFVVWWAIRTVAIWRDPDSSTYARAASIAVAVILAHSAVDYPLRTAAIAAVFAACCALMLEPRSAERPVKRRSKVRHLQAD